MLLISQSSSAQTQYSPVFIDQCTQEVVEMTGSFSIFDGETWHRNYSFFNVNGYSLNKTGRHSIQFNTSRDSVIFHYDPTIKSRDTFYVPAIEEWFAVSNPPNVSYTFCGKVADGKLKDYYYDGSLRKSGTFKEGKLIDTLFTYHSNGQLAGKMHSPELHYFSKTYYENGQLHNHINYKKRIEKTYYDNGQVSADVKWSRRFRYKTRTFEPDGSLSGEIRKNKRFYYRNDTLESKLISRRQIGTMIRDWFVSNNSFRYGPWYSCKWKSFNESGDVHRIIKFQNPGRFDSRFPDSLETDQYDLVSEILFYSNGKKAYKMEVRLKKMGDDYKRYVIYFRRNGNDWILEGESPIDTFEEKLQLYTKKVYTN